MKQSQNESHSVAVRLTSFERADVAALAAIEGKAISTYIRDMLTAASTRSRPTLAASGALLAICDTLQDLAECAKDGEYGFRACAEQAKRQDLKSTFLQRADDCRGAAQELNQQIRSLGGTAEDHGSASGALHRGWVSVKASLSTYDDKAVLEECERGEDNAKARYTKALKQPLPAAVKLIVERQMQGLQRNHDQIKMLRDQLRASS